MENPFFARYRHTYFLELVRAEWKNKSTKIEDTFSNKRSLRLKDL
jgi:hypothetical protein